MICMCSPEGWKLHCITDNPMENMSLVLASILFLRLCLHIRFNCSFGDRRRVTHKFRASRARESENTVSVFSRLCLRLVWWQKFHEQESYTIEYFTNWHRVYENFNVWGYVSLRQVERLKGEDTKFHPRYEIYLIFLKYAVQLLRKDSRPT